MGKRPLSVEAGAHAPVLAASFPSLPVKRDRDIKLKICSQVSKNVFGHLYMKSPQQQGFAEKQERGACITRALEI